MRRRHAVLLALLLGVAYFDCLAMAEPTKTEPGEISVGIIGLDTSHVVAFTKELNRADPPADVAGCRVVAAYPGGSPDIAKSIDRVPEFTKQLREMGVEIVDSVDELVTKVDAVMLESLDGRPHLEQIRPVLRAKLPVYVDKPLAGSLSDVIAIVDEAKAAGVPFFSSSSLRFGKNSLAARNGSLGRIERCETSSPASIEPTHPDLYWYGIHGVEALFTVMGTGCESVVRSEEDGKIVVTGTWSDGRTGVFREGKGYSGHASGTEGEGPVGSFDGYRPLVVSIVHMFRTGETPVAPEETLEIYAFMEAADESKRRGGQSVRLEDVISKARAAIESRQ